MELEHQQEEPDRLTEDQLFDRYEHWNGHAQACMRGLKLALKHMDNINRTIEVQRGLGLQDDNTNT